MTIVDFLRFYLEYARFGKLFYISISDLYTNKGFSVVKFHIVRIPNAHKMSTARFKKVNFQYITY